MNAAMINNLSIDELEQYTRSLIDNGDYGPTVVAILEKWISYREEGMLVAKLEQTIKFMREQAGKVVDAAEEIVGAY